MYLVVVGVSYICIFLRKVGTLTVRVEENMLDILMKDDIFTTVISIESKITDPLTISGPRWICVETLGQIGPAVFP